MRDSPLQSDSLLAFRRLVASEAAPAATIAVPFDREPTSLHASRLRLQSHLDRVKGDLAVHQTAATHQTGEDRAETLLERLEDVIPELESIASVVETLVVVGRGSEQACFLAAPVEMPSAVRVGESPAFRPLLYAIQRMPRFRLLGVSEGRVDAWDGDAFGLHPLRVPDMPESLEAALGDDLDRRRVLSHRSDHPMPGRAGNAAIYHGHGGAPDARTRDRERFHRVLGSTVSRAWRSYGLPIVLAAEERTASAFREHANLPTLVTEELRVDPGDLPRSELHRAAFAIARTHREHEQSELRKGYERARSRGKTIEEDVEALFLAAVGGRIRRLWIERDAVCPGRIIEMQARRSDETTATDDLLDAIVDRALEHDSKVEVVDPGETPTGQVACAELR